MARIGYARVSTRKQNEDFQHDRLTAAGCDKIFTDKASGKLARRPGWDECLKYLRTGDQLVITKLDRAGRSVKHLIDVVADLAERGIDLVVLDQGIDTSTPGGRLTFHIFAAMAEFVGDLISENTLDGLEAARARGRTGGRKAKLTDRQIAQARKMYEETGDDGKRLHTVEQIGQTFGVGRSTIYRHLTAKPAAPIFLEPSTTLGLFSPGWNQ